MRLLTLWSSDADFKHRPGMAGVGPGPRARPPAPEPEARGSGPGARAQAREGFQKGNGCCWPGAQGPAPGPRARGQGIGARGSMGLAPRAREGFQKGARRAIRVHFPEMYPGTFRKQSEVRKCTPGVWVHLPRRAVEYFL